MGAPSALQRSGAKDYWESFFTINNFYRREKENIEKKSTQYLSPLEKGEQFIINY